MGSGTGVNTSEGTDRLPLPGTKPRLLNCPVRSLVTVLAAHTVLHPRYELDDLVIFASTPQGRSSLM